MRGIEYLQYPVLAFYKGFRIDIHTSAKGLAYINHLGLKKMPFDNSFIIDSAGKKYGVLKVWIRGFAWPYIDILLLDPNYRLAFDLGEPEQLTADELREIVLSCLSKDRIRNKRYINLVSKAKSISQIIAAVDKGLYGNGGVYDNENEC